METNTLYGIRFDRVEIEQSKLIVSLNGLFEAVFYLDLNHAIFMKPNIEPILNLYDYRILLDELQDKYYIHGAEF